MTDAGRRELTSGLTEAVKHHEYGEFIIPAGILIGLGVGLLVDHLFSGFLVGLGLGIAGSELLPFFRKPHEDECREPRKTNVTMLFIAAFLILTGISVVWASAAILPYVFAGLFILAGIGFLVRGFPERS